MAYVYMYGMLCIDLACDNHYIFIYYKREQNYTTCHYFEAYENRITYEDV